MKEKGYSLSVLSNIACLVLLILIGFYCIEKDFYLTLVASIFICIALSMVMNMTFIAYIYRLPFFLFVTLGILQRTIFLLIEPDSFSFSSRVDLTDNILAGSIGYSAIYIFLVYGIFRLFPNKISRLPTEICWGDRYSEKSYGHVLYAYYFISLVVNAYLAVFLQVGLQGGASSSIGYLIRIFDLDLALAMVIIFYISNNRKLECGKILIKIVAITYIIFSLYRGSRGAILTIALLVWFGFAYSKPSLKIKIRSIWLTLSVLIVVGIPLFYIGLAFREYQIGTGVLDFTSTFADSQIFDLLALISYSLGEVDNMAAVLFEMEINSFKEFPMFIGNLDAIVKGFLPSTIYLQTTLSIDQMYPYIFRNLPLDVSYAEHWTGLGAMIAYSNVYLAPIVLSLYSYFWVWFSNKINKKYSGHFWMPTFVVIVAYLLLYGSVCTGSVAVIYPEFLRFLVILAFLVKLSKILIRFRPSESQ